MQGISLRLIGLDGSNQASPANGVVIERDETDGALFLRFDQEAVIMRLLETFDGIIIGTQDILLEDAQVVESMLASHGLIDNPLIASLYRKAENLGPAVPFTFNVENDMKVKGSVRRFDINFRYSENLAVDVRSRIKQFLEQFGVGEIHEWEISD